MCRHAWSSAEDAHARTHTHTLTASIFNDDIRLLGTQRNVTRRIDTLRGRNYMPRNDMLSGKNDKSETCLTPIVCVAKAFHRIFPCL